MDYSIVELDVYTYSKAAGKKGETLLFCCFPIPCKRRMFLKMQKDLDLKSSYYGLQQLLRPKNRMALRYALYLMGKTYINQSNLFFCM